MKKIQIQIKHLCAFFAIICAVLFSYSAQLNNANLNPNDDYLWFFYTGFQYENLSLANKNNETLLNHIDNSLLDKASADRYRLRASYDKNYLFNSITYFLSYKFFKKLNIFNDLPEAKIKNIYALSFLSIFPICFILVYLISNLFDKKNALKNIFIISFALIIAASTTYLIDLYQYLNDNYNEIKGPFRFKIIINQFAGVGKSYYNLAASANTHDIIFSSFSSLVAPHIDFTPFGFAARCSFHLMIISFFILRLNNKYLSSYLVMAFLLFFHQSNAMMLAALIFSADLINRPRLILSKSCLMIIFLIISIYIINEKVIYFNGGIEISFFIATFLIYLFLIFCYKKNNFLISIIENNKFYKWIYNKQINDFIKDYIVIILVWILTFPLTYIMHRYLADQGVRDYIYEQLHGRSLIIFRIGVIVFISSFFVNSFISYYKKVHHKNYLITFVFSFWLFLLINLSFVSKNYSGGSISSSFNEYEIRNNSFIYNKDFKNNEDLIYYFMNKSILTNKSIEEYITFNDF